MKNGNGWTAMVIKSLLGIVVVGISTVLGIQHNDIQANDKDSRARDTIATEQLNKHIITAEKKHYEYAMRQEQFNGDLKELLAEMRTDLKYLKSNGN